MSKEKIMQEMEANKQDAYVQAVGQFILSHLKEHPSDEDKLSDEKKSIKGSLDAMRKVAEKQKQGNMAIIAPDQGYKIVLDYFGITDIPDLKTPSVKPEQTKPKKEAKPSSFSASLADFL